MGGLHSFLQLRASWFQKHEAREFKTVAKFCFVLRFGIAFRGQTPGTSGGGVETGTWHHTALVASGGRLKLYLDGQQVADEARSLEACTDHFRFGNFKNVTSDLQFLGRLEDAALYNRALTVDEISRMAAAGGNRGPQISFTLPAEGLSHVPFTVNATVTDDTAPMVHWFANPSTGVVFNPADAAMTDVKLPGAGTFTLGLEADDGGQTSFFEHSFPVITPTMAWRRSNFGSTENTGDGADTADPNENGIPNLLERALGYDPDSTQTMVETPEIEMVPVEGSLLPAIRLRRLKGGTETSPGVYQYQDLIFRIRGGEALDDAAAWPVLEVVEENAEDVGGGVERAVLRVPSQASLVNTYFLRLEVARE